MEFPKIRKIIPKTIADEIRAVTPDQNPPKIKDQYKNHMVDDVTVHASGSITTHSYSSYHLHGEYGHSFGSGFYVVDEKGEMVFAGEDGYNKLVEKCRPYWQVLKGLQERFKGYRVEPSRGERIAVNDKIIKGISFYPGMRMVSVDDEIEAIGKFIQLDIDRGRIVINEYGV